MAAHIRSRGFHLNAQAIALPSTTTNTPTNSSLTLHPPGLDIGTGTGTGFGVGLELLALARQASTVAYGLLGLGGCAPGIQMRGGRAGTRRVPRGILGAGEVEAIVESRQHDDRAEVEVPVQKRIKTKSVEEQADLELELPLGPRLEAPADPTPGIELSTGKADAPDLPHLSLQIEACPCANEELDVSTPGTEDWEPKQDHPSESSSSLGISEGTEAEASAGPPTLLEPPCPPEAPIHPDSATRSSNLSDEAEEMMSTADPTPNVAPEDSAAYPPCDHAEVRADFLRKVSAFTAARVSRCAPTLPLPRAVAPSGVSPLRPMSVDDPFAADARPFVPPAAPFVPAHPLALHYPSLLRSRLDQQQSPTPQPRAGRPPLRQQTVFFKHNQTQATQWQPSLGVETSTPTKRPAFWAPHPAGRRSCAVTIKAPPGASRDKENCAVV